MIEAHPSVNPLGSLQKTAKRTGVILSHRWINPASLVSGQYGAKIPSAALRTSGRLAPALALGAWEPIMLSVPSHGGAVIASR
jgi:hypothetical protein